MKLLLITQKVDRTDPILGFFHRWMELLAEQCETLTVIGQYVGEYSLPDNVTVLSLEKEKGLSKISQVFRFLALIWKHQSSYDSAFVHMTPIWVVFGGPLWWLLKKPSYLWYEVKRGSWRLTTALFWVRKVFSATEHGLPTIVKKQVVVGHGIDTDQFSAAPRRRESGLLLAIGRITRIKNFDRILPILAHLDAKYHLQLIGTPIRADDYTYLEDIQSSIKDLSLADRVSIGTLEHHQIPDALQRAELLLHACDGGLDKVVLESMACGTPVVSCSEAAASILPEECRATKENFAERVQAILNLSDAERNELAEELRKTVVAHHSLSQLITRLVGEMTSV